MTIAIDHSKISITAKLVAYARQFTDIPFAKFVSEHIGAGEAFNFIIRDYSLDSDMLKEYAVMLEARYKSTVHLIAQSGIKQVLELASGFSLRGLAMLRDPQMVYVESDLEDLNREKTKLVEQLRSEFPHEAYDRHKIVTANALDMEQLRNACQHFQRNQPLIIVHEGLMHYFSAAERDLLTQHIRTLLSEFSGGFWMTPDFVFKAEARKISEARKRLRQALSGLTDRNMYEAAFDSEERLQEFFKANHLQAKLKYQIDETPHLSSVERYHLSPEMPAKMRDHLKIWLLNPAA
ncbi:MAG TPA: class I SAM-dependent methyltransferase [Rickettsiales bacterium]|nr:class I SAM-dependent methyltransferase [Rickettsiales bacterium]